MEERKGRQRMEIKLQRRGERTRKGGKVYFSRQSLNYERKKEKKKKRKKNVEL